MKHLQDNDLFKTACIFAGIMCLLALAPLPMHSFKTAVHIVAAAAALWALYAAAARGYVLAALAFLAVAVMLNPFRQMTLDVSVMRGAYIFAAVLFFAASARLKVEPKAETASSTYLN